MLAGAGTALAGDYSFDSSLKADLDGIEKVRIEVRNGSIEIRTWDRNEIDVDIEERVNKHDRDDAERIAGEAELTSRKQGSTLVLEIDYGDLSKKEQGHYSCSVDVRLPERLALHLRSTNGAIRTEEMKGEIDARTTNGAISVGGSEGDVDVQTTNGAVRVGWVGGDLDVRSTNGALNLSGAGGDVEARTTNGGILLRVDPESNFVVEAETTNGRISEDLSTSRFEAKFNRRRTHLIGAYGKGGEANKIRLKTTNGRVTIEEA
jgi:DUF4097 and DUF4098 domain-containing protein YvlB